MFICTKQEEKYRWVEHGYGALRLLIVNKTKIRKVKIIDNNGKLILNGKIFNDVQKLKKIRNLSVCWDLKNYASDNNKYSLEKVVLLCFKNVEIRDSFYLMFTTRSFHIDHLKNSSVKLKFNKENQTSKVSLKKYEDGSKFEVLWNMACELSEFSGLKKSKSNLCWLHVIYNENGKSFWIEALNKENIYNRKYLFNIITGSTCLILKKNTCHWTSWNFKLNEYKKMTFYATFKSEANAKQFELIFHAISYAKATKQFVQAIINYKMLKDTFVIKENSFILLKNKSELFNGKIKIMLILKEIIYSRENAILKSLIEADLKDSLKINSRGAYKIKDYLYRTKETSLEKKLIIGQEDDFNGMAFNLKPIIRLDKKIINSGDLEDQIIFKNHSKVFRLDKKQWKERGLGLLTISRTKQGKFRIIQRDDITQKLRVHHYIGLNQTIQGKKGKEKMLIWSGVDVSEDSNSCQAFTFCGKFQTIEIAKTFEAKFKEASSYII